MTLVPASGAGSDLTRVVARFCRALRERGVPATPAEAIEAARTLTLIDLGDRQELYLALRAVLATRREDFAVFDELFPLYWRAGAADIGRAPPGATRKSPPRSSFSLERWMRPEGEPDTGEDERVGIAQASDLDVTRAQDFSTFGARELDEIARVARQLARRLAARPSRRWQPASRGARVHLRRTVRQSLKTGGDATELVFRERKMRRTRLVALCDVSGSMELYSRFLLQFLFALQHSFARVESFVFATRLNRVTEQLRDATYRGALGRLTHDVGDWNGGTRIGASLTRFADDWPRLLDRRTVVIILSDGWDTGEPEQLARALGIIHQRSGRVLWLNPLMASPGFEPLTRGLQAAIPYVDDFAPVHNLASLRALARYLVL